MPQVDFITYGPQVLWLFLFIFFFFFFSYWGFFQLNALLIVRKLHLEKKKNILQLNFFYQQLLFIQKSVLLLLVYDFFKRRLNLTLFYDGYRMKLTFFCAVLYFSFSILYSWAYSFFLQTQLFVLLHFSFLDSSSVVSRLFFTKDFSLFDNFWSDLLV